MTTDAGRALAAARRKALRPCAVCGRTVAMLTTQRYCSEACKQRAKYARKKMTT